MQPTFFYADIIKVSEMILRQYSYVTTAVQRSATNGLNGLYVLQVILALLLSLVALCIHEDEASILTLLLYVISNLRAAALLALTPS